MNIKRVIVLVELDNGHAHQVLATAEQKQVSLALLRNESGELMLSPRLEPMAVKVYAEADESPHTKTMRTLKDTIKTAIALKELVGEHTLSGCDITTEQMHDWGESHVSSGVMRFVMDGKTYEAIEDPDDGYRSSLEGLHLADAEHSLVTNTFEPVRVRASHRTEGDYGSVDDVLELRRLSDDALILEVGTENTEDYYPGCVMAFNAGGIRR